MPDRLLIQSAPARAAYIQTHTELLNRLATDGQQPTALFITCADSRITPESLFDLAPGDYFIVRNVANTVPPDGKTDHSSLASVEYAVQALNVPHIVICGHTQCGGVQAVDKPLDAEIFPALAHWLDVIRPAQEMVDARQLNMDKAERHLAIVQQHVRNQLANLLTYPYVQERVAAGSIELHGWIYHLEEQKVSYLEHETGSFEMA